MPALNIKIDEASKAAIEAALHAINGKARAHAYTDLAEIVRLAEAAECALVALGLPKKLRTGAAWSDTSGSAVANAYDNRRDGTTVRLERRSTGWVLASAAKVTLYKEGGGQGRLSLTQAQADEATRRFQSQFHILPPVAATDPIENK
jgi:hypothetical protein